MYNEVFYIIIGILLFGYILDQILEYLNAKRWSPELPKEVEGIYDAEKYRKSMQYHKENRRFSMITDTFSLTVILMMLFFAGFAWVDSLARDVTNHPILVSLVFFGILMFASDIINTPFSIYDTFVIEQKYGFNTTTVKTYILDKIKGWFLTAIIGGGLLALIIWFYQLTTDYFWLIAWGAVSAFSVFMAMFYSNLIVPLFNKQTPLEQGELRDEIEQFSAKAGFKLDNIFVIDGSKRSTKSNAYFSGLGSKKRIVLFDTLIKDLTNQEITAVLAHEIGHYRKKHTLSAIFLSIIQMGITFFILSLFIDSPVLAQALGVEQPSFHIGLIAFGVLYSPISMIIGLGMNILSRKNEFQADKFAGENYDPGALQSGLKKLSVKNLSNLTPHPVYVFFNYSHPPVLQRLKRLEELKD